MRNRKISLRLFLLFCIVAGAAHRVKSEPLMLQSEANVMAEVVFTAGGAHDDPFNTVNLDVVFTTPSGQQLRVPAFWADGNSWKVRYASPEVGTHHFQSECSKADDAGLHGVKGEVEVRSEEHTSELQSQSNLV